MEDGHAPLVAAHHLAIDQAGPNVELTHGFDDQREAGGPVITVSGQEPDALWIASGHHPIAVVLDLVNPSRTRGRLVRGGWQARFDEPEGGTHTRKHWRFRCRNDWRESSSCVRRLNSVGPDHAMEKKSETS